MRIWYLSPVLGQRVPFFLLISLQQQACLKSNYIHYTRCHSEYLCQIGVHLQLCDSFKGVIFIQRWISLDDVRIPTKKLITFKTRNVKQELQLIKFNYVAPAFRSGELLVSNCELDFWWRVGGEHGHLLDLTRSFELFGRWRSSIDWSLLFQSYKCEALSWFDQQKGSCA